MNSSERGAQRQSPAQLEAYEALRFGMFIHFGMSTFVGAELPDGSAAASRFAPTHLDPAQWVAVARDSGMRYAVLTAKHVAGHCLWPSRLTDYHAGRDIVGEFVKACRQAGILPGLYYCSWDNHHRMGSKTPSDTSWDEAQASPAYMEFMSAQVDELLTNYGPLGEFWLDIPHVLPRPFRQSLYDKVAAADQKTMIVANYGLDDKGHYPVERGWPTDVLPFERRLPAASVGYEKHRSYRYDPWQTIEGQRFRLPGEICDTISGQWFHEPEDRLRDELDLYATRLTAHTRGVNLLLNVPPDTTGLIQAPAINRLSALRKRAEADKLF